MRILFVDAQYPMPDRASADVRMFAIVRMLREQGHLCDYFVTDPAEAEARYGTEVVALYRSALRRLEVATLERMSFEQVLVDQRYDVVFFKYFYPAEFRVPLVRIWQPQARVVVDSVDLVYVRLLAKAKVSDRPADLQDAEATRKREIATYASADLVVTVTDVEAKTLSRMLPSRPVHVIPNIHDMPIGTRIETGFPSLLFIGVFSHEPNVDAVLWFARDIWPGVREAFADARFRVVGGQPPPAIQALAGDGIEVTGYVPDTQPYLSESWISVAPLRFGAGMKGKVGEAMAAGLPVVTTSFGAEGFGLTPGEHLLVADDVAAFTRAIMRLIQDPNLRISIGRAGRTFVEAHYSSAAVNGQVEALVARLAAIVPRRIAHARARQITRRAHLWLQRNLLWRLRTNV